MELVVLVYSDHLLCFRRQNSALFMLTTQCPFIVCVCKNASYAERLIELFFDTNITLSCSNIAHPPGLAWIDDQRKLMDAEICTCFHSQGTPWSQNTTCMQVVFLCSKIYSQHVNSRLRAR